MSPAVMTKEEQRSSALLLANQVRTQRSQLKKDLKAGRVDIFKLLEDPPEYIYSMKIMDLLLAMPKFGRDRVRRALTICHTPSHREVGDLTARQREGLVWGIRRAQPRTTK